jgi:hypothetical protein
MFCLFRTQELARREGEELSRHLRMHREPKDWVQSRYSGLAWTREQGSSLCLPGRREEDTHTSSIDRCMVGKLEGWGDMEVLSLIMVIEDPQWPSSGYGRNPRVAKSHALDIVALVVVAAMVVSQDGVKPEQRTDDLRARREEGGMVEGIRVDQVPRLPLASPTSASHGFFSLLSHLALKPLRPTEVPWIPQLIESPSNPSMGKNWTEGLAQKPKVPSPEESSLCHIHCPGF